MSRGLDERPWLDQDGYAVRFDWGPNGLRRLAPRCDVLVVVDVLRFTTSVDVAVARGAEVLPYRWADGAEAAFASDHGAVLAGRDDTGDGWSLSPASLATIPAGTRVVLTSANGSALAFAAAEAGVATVVAGGLRNASAVAAHVARIIGVRPVADRDGATPHSGAGATSHPGDGVPPPPATGATSHAATGATSHPLAGVAGVIAAGERWRGGTGPLRPAVEDLLGAGAILAGLDPSLMSPEARAARGAFLAERDRLDDALASCASGRELATSGRGRDLVWAAALDASTTVPVLRGDRFVAA